MNDILRRFGQAKISKCHHLQIELIGSKIVFSKPVTRPVAAAAFVVNIILTCAVLITVRSYWPQLTGAALVLCLALLFLDRKKRATESPPLPTLLPVFEIDAELGQLQVARHYLHPKGSKWKSDDQCDVFRLSELESFSICHERGEYELEGCLFAIQRCGETSAIMSGTAEEVKEVAAFFSFLLGKPSWIRNKKIEDVLVPPFRSWFQ